MPAAVTIQLPDAAAATLDRHIATHRPGQSREAVLAEIVSDWLAAQPSDAGDHPDEGLRPDELNASNDS